MEYAVEVAEMMKRERPGDYEQLVEKIGLKQEEIRAWQKAAEDMYLPYSDELKIIPQDDSFLHRKRIDIDQIPEDQFPLLLHWHYLNIYRHQICKQPDVLLLMMLLRKRFTVEEIKRNYDYYEPITTHDSSLSPSVFSILACDIGYEKDAYDYFIQTVRMDLDDYNGNVKHGIHAANMGGTWNAVIYGFAGMKPDSEGLNFCPHLPEKWHGLSFKVRHKNRKILVELKRDSAKFTLLEGDSIKLHYFNEEILLMQGLTVTKEVKNVKV
jgi:alpha,alpha-trehalose phosphorylase